MKTLHSSLFFFFTAAGSADAHTRLECPPPRSGETGEKDGPCDASDDPDALPAYPLIPGALNTITWLESISHPGAPARFALSKDGDDSAASFESCLLLDHVPHDSYSSPLITDQLTWHRSSITLWIPDVYCERCHLQLVTVMSDEAHGVPVDTTCAYGGALAAGTIAADSNLPACPVVYHSCAPVSINGTQLRNEMDTCNTTEFEAQLDWPMRPQDAASLGMKESLYDYSTYYYKGDPGLYNLSDSRLLAAGSPIANCSNLAFCDPAEHLNVIMNVPADAKYTRLEGTCAAMVTMEVMEFQVGVLPSEPKNMSTAANLPPGTAGELDPCTPCAVASPCFNEACGLRDAVTGEWTGPAAQCNDAIVCEPCFPDSPCLFDPNSLAETTDSDAGEEAQGTADAGTGGENSSSGAFLKVVPTLGFISLTFLIGSAI